MESFPQGPVDEGCPPSLLWPLLRVVPVGSVCVTRRLRSPRVLRDDGCPSLTPSGRGILPDSSSSAAPLLSGRWGGMPFSEFRRPLYEKQRDEHVDGLEPVPATLSSFHEGQRTACGFAWPLQVVRFYVLDTEY